LGQTNDGQDVMEEGNDGHRESGDPTESTEAESGDQRTEEPQGSGAQATPSESAAVT